METVPDRFKTQEMCDTAVDTCPFVFHSVSDGYITQELWNKIFSEDNFKLKHSHDSYDTPKISNKAVDSCLLALDLFLIGSLRVILLKIL